MQKTRDNALSFFVLNPCVIVKKQREALGLETMVKASVVASHAGRVTVKDADVQCLKRLSSVADGSVCVPKPKRARNVD